MFKHLLNTTVTVTMDRPPGSKHPTHGFYYPRNYGFVKDTISGDNEPVDAYVLGVFEPVTEFIGQVIAIIHRTNDNDDKLVVAPADKDYTDEQIIALTEFQERFFDSFIIRKNK